MVVLTTAASVSCPLSRSSVSRSWRTQLMEVELSSLIVPSNNTLSIASMTIRVFSIWLAFKSTARSRSRSSFVQSELMTSFSCSDISGFPLRKMAELPMETIYHIFYSVNSGKRTLKTVTPHEQTFCCGAGVWLPILPLNADIHTDGSVLLIQLCFYMTAFPTSCFEGGECGVSSWTLLGCFFQQAGPCSPARTFAAPYQEGHSFTLTQSSDEPQQKT